MAPSSSAVVVSSSDCLVSWLSLAPQGASQPSAASPMVSKKWRCTSPSCTHPQLRLSTCFHGHRELAPGCDSGRLAETATGTGLTRGTGPGHGGTTRSTSLISTVTDLRMLQHQPHTTARMLQHLHWCQRSWHCTPSSCTQLRMSTCCTLCCPQHRKAPRNCQRHLPWCRGSWRCTSPSCARLRMNTCYTLRCPRYRKAPFNRQRLLHLVSKKLALHVTELHTPTAGLSLCCTHRCPQHRQAPCHRQWHLHWCRRSWRCTSPNCTQKQLRLNMCCTLCCP